MFEDLMIRHCAPALAGIKTGNLVCASVICNEAPDDEVLAACRKLGAALA